MTTHKIIKFMLYGGQHASCTVCTVVWRDGVRTRGIWAHPDPMPFVAVRVP
jgi:hypothetical protein